MFLTSTPGTGYDAVLYEIIYIYTSEWKFYLNNIFFSDSGVGAGIDSYYEYVAKAYVLLGDETYLTRTFSNLFYILELEGKNNFKI